jgi:type IV/VI secretion system ImpK/VasF family protein
MPWSIEPVALTELSSKIFAAILRLRAKDDYGDLHGLRRDCEQLLSSFDEAWRRRCGTVDPEAAAGLAKFAFAALIDETVAHSKWSYRDEWEHDSLELRMFGTDTRGTKFYANADRLMKSADAMPALLLVHYTTLQLGFRGQYIHDEESRQKFMDDLRHRLLVPEGTDLGTLSPPLKPPEPFVRSRFAELPGRFQKGCWIAVGLLLAIYVFFQVGY